MGSVSLSSRQRTSSAAESPALEPALLSGAQWTRMTSSEGSSNACGQYNKFVGSEGTLRHLFRRRL